MLDMAALKELWPEPVINEEANTAWWDSRAARFASSRKGGQKGQDSLCLQVIDREGMVFPGCRVLDVGCGAGAYAFALARREALVEGIDISPKMIARAVEEDCKGTRFSVENWKSLDLEGRGWMGAFDLVLANMTPAVSSAESFLKLAQAGRRWCLMVKSIRRTDAVGDTLRDRLGIETHGQAYEPALAHAFHLLWFQGLRPRVEYEDKAWESCLPLEEAVKSYALRLSVYKKLSGADMKNLRRTLEELAVEGVVHEQTALTRAALMWRLD